MKRRTFLGHAAGVATAGLFLRSSSAGQKAGANERIAVALMGVRGRGGRLLDVFSSLSDVEVAYVCDVDESVRNSRAEAVAAKTGRRPRTINDFREALDDASVDALVIGTPDHWHAIAAILACQAGKDVYVEKPDGHDVVESRAMAMAAEKYKRVVQMGTQSRNSPHLLTAMKYIGEGKLGRVRFAKAWESSRQGSIGHTLDSDPPSGVDYDMWLGPAPKRPFNRRRFHGSWRWFFDYGTGDLGNDGVHRLDIARWGLETALAGEGKTLPALPQAVSAHGGKLYFDDDQEWPDTLMVTYDYPECVLTYEMRIWTPYRLDGETEGAAVLGDKGSITIGNRRWRAFDERGGQVAEDEGGYNDVGHVRNFLDCMRSRARPAADLATVGHPSSMLCHLGNAAWRVGRTVRLDPETCTFGDPEANRYLGRPSYRKPWVLPELAGG